MFVPKRGGIHLYIHVLVGELWKYSCTAGYLMTAFTYCYINLCLIEELYVHKAVTLHCAKVEGGVAQGPATQVTHLRLNQPFSFCSDVCMS